MKKALIIALLFSATAAQATEISQVYSGSTVLTVDSILAIPLSVTGGTVVTSASISGQTMKLVVAAKEDAATLLASDGAIRGVALQQALEAIRSENPKLQASDMEIAEGILKM